MCFDHVVLSLLGQVPRISSAHTFSSFGLLKLAPICRVEKT